MNSRGRGARRAGQFDVRNGTRASRVPGGAAVAPGLYFVRLATAGRVETRRLVAVR